MADQEWWRPVLQWGLWFLIMSLVMGWLARSRMRPRNPAETNSLHHPTSNLIIGLLCFLFFAAIAVLSVIFPGKDGSIWITLRFVGSAMIGAPLILEYVRVRHHLEPGGMRYQKLLGGSGKLLWEEVVSVRYSPSAKWFRLQSRLGSVVRVSVILIGLPGFARALLESVPAPSIDADTRVLLEQTASGSPPSIWG